MVSFVRKLTHNDMKFARLREASTQHLDINASTHYYKYLEWSHYNNDVVRQQ